MKLFERSRRGISTVVATAIMLSAVAILGSTLVMWSNSNLNAYETKIANVANTNTNKFNEFLSIENVWFCKNTCPQGKPTPNVNVTLTNGGTIGLNVTQIKLNSTSTSPLVNSITKVTMIPGQSYMWESPSSFSWIKGVPVVVTVTTARGTIFTTQVTP